MADTPTFDYLTVVTTHTGPNITKYIVKSRSINFKIDANKLESYRVMLESIFKYLDSISRPMPKPAVKISNTNRAVFKPAEKRAATFSLIRIYSDSITIRNNGIFISNQTLPLRSTSTNQLIKILFTDISESFSSEINNFVLDLEKAATSQARVLIQLHAP
jgi:hypothetical protein